MGSGSTGVAGSSSVGTRQPGPSPSCTSRTRRPWLEPPSIGVFRQVTSFLGRRQSGNAYRDLEGRTLNLTLDHVELFVPDRAQAAEWYARVLGCRPVPGTEHWASHPQGPLMLSPDGGDTKLALFVGEPQGGRPTAGFHRVAFRLGGIEWLDFVARLAELGLTEGGGSARVVDHAGAWSLYFTDPFGHHLEVTTYEVDVVRRAREGS